MDPADKDVTGSLLNKDRTFGHVYKDFITGPSKEATYGYFGVDQVTGNGYAMSTDTWADAPEEPVDGHCIDTWTMIPVTVPVAGLTPYPADVRGQPDWAAQVIITPVAMLTLGNASTASVAASYDSAYAALNVPAAGGLYGAGLVNSDPMLMLQSSDPVKVGTAVKMLGASAKVLDTLSVARALYECREGSGARLSNELFYQWTGALIKLNVLHSAAVLASTFEDLCLTTCASDAATSLAAIHKQLDEVTVSFSWGCCYAVLFAACSSLLLLLPTALGAAVPSPRPLLYTLLTPPINQLATHRTSTRASPQPLRSPSPCTLT